MQKFIKLSKMWNFAPDFNLTPIIAKAFYQYISLYYQERANVTISTGEIDYEAMATEEPTGEPIRLTRKTLLVPGRRYASKGILTQDGL